jgi:hypothetical protein
MSALIELNVVSKITALRTTATQCRQEIAAANKSGDEFTKMFVVSAARQKLLDLLSDDLIDFLKGLQGSPLGFRTDKDDKGGYDKHVIRTVAAQALISGLRMTDNEVNIIGGNLYAAKEGCRRLVKETAGLTDLDFIPGIPEVVYGEPIKKHGKNGEYTVQRCVAYVPAIVKYRLNGKQFEERYEGDYRVVVKIDGGGEDMAIGKAERKVYKRLAEKLSGIKLGDDDDDQPIDVTAEVIPPTDQDRERHIIEFREYLSNTTKRAEVTKLVEEYKGIAVAEGWPDDLLNQIRKEGEVLYKQLAK